MEKDVEIALRLLERNRETQRRSYYKHREERQAKRRAYYHKQKEEAAAKKKLEDEVKFKEAVEQAVKKTLGEVGVEI